MTIRLLQKGDVSELLAFANTLVAEDTFIMLSGKKMTFTEEKKYVDDALAKIKKKEKIHIVAVEGSRIIGSAEVRRGEKRKYHMGEIGISVVKDYRKQGIGARLMEELLARAGKMGLRMLMLHCFENNTAALSLYKKFGFRQCGLLPGALFWRGSYYGEVSMYKTLWNSAPYL